MGNTIQEAKDSALRSEKLAEATPEVMTKFGELCQTVMESSKLDNKTKELIAITIGITVKCMPCILHHVKQAIECGVTREELVGCIEICTIMGGGPGSAYGAIALDTYDDFIKSNN